MRMRQAVKHVCTCTCWSYYKVLLSWRSDGWSSFMSKWAACNGEVWCSHARQTSCLFLQLAIGVTVKPNSIGNWNSDSRWLLIFWLLNIDVEFLFHGNNFKMLWGKHAIVELWENIEDTVCHQYVLIINHIRNLPAVALNLSLLRAVGKVHKSPVKWTKLFFFF